MEYEPAMYASEASNLFLGHDDEKPKRFRMTATQLSTTQLGETRLEITRVGLGAWAIGGLGSRSGASWAPRPLALVDSTNERGL